MARVKGDVRPLAENLYCWLTFGDRVDAFVLNNRKTISKVWDGLLDKTKAKYLYCARRVKEEYIDSEKAIQKESYDLIFKYVQGTANTSPKFLGMSITEALIEDHKRLKATLKELKQKYGKGVE